MTKITENSSINETVDTEKDTEVFGANPNVVNNTQYYNPSTGLVNPFADASVGEDILDLKDASAYRSDASVIAADAADGVDTDYKFKQRYEIVVNPSTKTIIADNVSTGEYVEIALPTTDTSTFDKLASGGLGIQYFINNPKSVTVSSSTN